MTSRLETYSKSHYVLSLLANFRRAIKVNIALVPVWQGRIGRGVSTFTKECIESALINGKEFQYWPRPILTWIIYMDSRKQTKLHRSLQEWRSLWRRLCSKYLWQFTIARPNQTKPDTSVMRIDAWRRLNTESPLYIVPQSSILD